MKSLFVIFIGLGTSLLFSQNSNIAILDTIEIYANTVDINLKEKAYVFKSEKRYDFSEISQATFTKPSDWRDFFYFDFNQNTIAIQFAIKNHNHQNRKLYIRFSNALIYELIIYKRDSITYQNSAHNGIKFPFKLREEKNRNLVFPVELAPEQTNTFIIHLNKAQGRPLVTNIRLMDEKTIRNKELREIIILGMYLGLSSIFILISFYLWFILKNKLFVFYANYILFLGLFIMSYTGIFQQLLMNENQVLNKYFHYAIFSEIALIFFIIFTQLFLKTKQKQPKLYQYIKYTILTLVILRIGLHLSGGSLFEKFIPVFMKIWYGIYLLTIIIISYQIICLYQKNKPSYLLFAVAYLVMILGVLASVLYHSAGLVNTMLLNLPLLLYTSLVEIILISIALGYMMKDIIIEKNALQIEIKIEKEKNLQDAIILNNKRKIYLNQLKYIKSEGNYLIFYTLEGKIMDRHKLKTIMNQLPAQFVKVHRSYIINKNYIQSTTSTHIVLDNQIEIPLSRIFSKNL